MATIPTGGFARASVMPNPGLVDPRLLAADYSGLTRGIGQGLELVNSFAGARQLALDRADANALRDLRQRAATAQLELAPQLAADQAALSGVRRNIAESTPIELAEGSTVSRTPGGDIIQLDTVTQVDPVTRNRELVTRAARPLALAEDVQRKDLIAQISGDRAAALTAANDARAETARVKAENDRINADAAKLRAEAYSRSVDSGAKRTVTPDLVFNRRNAQHLADLDETLGLGSVDRIQAFGSDPTGRIIIDKINSATNQKLPLRLLPEEQAFLTDFRIRPAVSAAVTDMAVQPNAPGSLPTAAAETLPMASPVRQVLSPQDQQALNWVQANPQDPRAQAIRQRLGL